jgi:hypothetical protein
MFGGAVAGYLPTPHDHRAHVTFDLAVRAAMDAGVLKVADPQEVAEVVWAALHGLVSLELAGHLDPRDGERRLEAMLAPPERLAAQLALTKGRLMSTDPRYLEGSFAPERDALENLSTTAFGNALIKYDLERDTSEAHVFGRDAYVGEGVFVPRTADAAEDDGYVMAFAHNSERDAADLVILSAQDFTGAPLARVHLPASNPLGFHGSWISDD